MRRAARGMDITCITHEFHETCHSVTFYFMKKDSKQSCDTATPESIHIKDESKRGTAFAFIFGVNWLWCCGVTASFGVFFHEIKCNGMTSFMEFMMSIIFPLPAFMSVAYARCRCRGHVSCAHWNQISVSTIHKLFSYWLRLFCWKTAYSLRG